MATTALQVARREFAAFLGYAEIMGKDGSAWQTTTNLTTSSVIVSTQLGDYGLWDMEGAGSGDDIVQNWWVLLLDEVAATGSTGVNSGVQRRLSVYDASLSTLSVTGTNLAAENEAVYFELHKYSPTLLREVLNTARIQAFPQLFQPITRTLFTARDQVRYEIPSAIIGRPHSIWLSRGVQSKHANNILTDGGFEVWTDATTLTNYTATTLDVAKESAGTSPKNFAVFRDGFSARCTSQTGSAGTLLQSISSPGTHSGQRISLSVWVYCLTASVVSARLTVNGTITLGTAASGGLHTGSGWELLTVSVDSLVTITTLTAGVSVVSTATDNTEFYVDEAILVVGPTQEPEEYGELVHNWEYIPQVQGTTLRSEVVFPGSFPDNYRLRFEGKGYLSSVTAEADTFEVGAPQTQLLYSYAAQELFRRLRTNAQDSGAEYYDNLIRLMAHRIEENSVFAVAGRKSRLQIPDWS